MRERGFLGTGGLFVSRPRSVTVGLGIAGAMAGIGILVGLNMLLGSSTVYVGMDRFLSISNMTPSRAQGVSVLLVEGTLATAVVRALRPARIPRFITIAISGVVGLLWFYIDIQDASQTPAGLVRLVIITAAMTAPSLLLMTQSASEFYGD